MTADFSTKVRDVAIIGGGTAGMSAAIFAVQQGLDVEVFDAAGESFDKPCGEGLMPCAVALLKDLGVHIPEYVPLQGIRYFDTHQKSLSGTFIRNEKGWGVRRATLRYAMWRRARELGVAVHQLAITEISEQEGAYIVDGKRFKWLCLATGSQNRLPQQLGFRNVVRARQGLFRFGMRRHLKVKPWSDFVEIYWGDFLELYVTPVSSDVVNIAILSWKPIDFDSALALFPAIQSKIEVGHWLDETAGYGPMARRLEPKQRQRILLAGDAGGFLDAMTGEGNALAMRTGICAIQSMILQDEALFLKTKSDSSSRVSSQKSYMLMWWQQVWLYWFLTSGLLLLTRTLRRRKIFLRIIFVLPVAFKIGLKTLSYYKPRTHTQC